MFDTIISVVKNLPHILGEVTKRLKEFVREVFSIAGSTIVEELKLVVNHVRQFVDGVKQDVLKFYHVSRNPLSFFYQTSLNCLSIAPSISMNM